MSLNIAAITGPLGQNPEITMYANGKQSTKFSIASNRDYKDEEGERPVDWIPVIGWGKGPANYAQKVHLGKGDIVSVTGRVETSIYTDKNGQKRKDTFINIEHMYLLQKKRDKNGDNGNAKAEGNQAPQNTNIPAYRAEEEAQMQKDLDDLPF